LSKKLEMGKVAVITGVVGTIVGTAATVAGLVFGSDIHDHFFPPKKNDDMKTVVMQLNQSLDDATNGRATMGDVNKAVNNCREKTNPWIQANRVHRVVLGNRDFVIAGVKDVGQVDDSDARAVVAAFKYAYTWSRKVDHEYEAWLRTWRGQKKDGCKPLHNIEYKDFNKDNDRATKAKQFFLKLYNPPALKYRLGQRKVTEI
jgi:hypothetical protein